MTEGRNRIMKRRSVQSSELVMPLCQPPPNPHLSNLKHIYQYQYYNIIVAWSRYTRGLWTKTAKCVKPLLFQTIPLPPRPPPILQQNLLQSLISTCKVYTSLVHICRSTSFLSFHHTLACIYVYNVSYIHIYITNLHTSQQILQ